MGRVTVRHAQYHNSQAMQGSTKPMQEAMSLFQKWGITLQALILLGRSFGPGLALQGLHGTWPGRAGPVHVSLRLVGSPLAACEAPVRQPAHAQRTP